jgi:hypothetical protein
MPKAVFPRYPFIPVKITAETEFNLTPTPICPSARTDR